LWKRARKKIEAARRGEPIDIGAERKEALQAFHAESHIPGGSFIREIVFGFNDGVIATFAVVSGLMGAALSNFIIILAGLAEAIGGAVAMGLGAYISTKSQIEFYESEIERERKEIETIPEWEKRELREAYRVKGFNGELLEKIVEKISSEKELWLKAMLEDELGLVLNRFDDPVKVGLAMALSFLFGAVIPISPFLFLPRAWSLFGSVSLSLVSIFLMGAVKSIITYRSWIKSGLEMFLIGVLAASSAYFIGTFISP
jgi:VIT1/CCC1 family predicted Fe2+/Mn2+ transporter